MRHITYVAVDFFAHHQRMGNNNISTCFDANFFMLQKCFKQMLQQYVLSVSFDMVMLHVTSDNVAAGFFSLVELSDAPRPDRTSGR